VTSLDIAPRLRTIADLDGAPGISVAHLAEALQYRSRGLG